MKNDTLEQVSFGLDLVNLARKLDDDSPELPINAADVDQIEDVLRPSAYRRKLAR